MLIHQRSLVDVLATRSEAHSVVVGCSAYDTDMKVTRLYTIGMLRFHVIQIPFDQGSRVVQHSTSKLTCDN